MKFVLLYYLKYFIRSLNMVNLVNKSIYIIIKKLNFKNKMPELNIFFKNNELCKV